MPGSAPRHRGRRIRQDQHAGASRRPPDPWGRRSPPHPPPHLLTPCRGRDGAPRRAHLAQGAGRQGRHHDRRAGMGRHVPRRRRAAPSRVRLRARPRPGLHDPRPRGLRRPDEPGAQRPRVRQDGAAIPDQGDVPRDLLALRQRRGAARGGPGAFVPVVRGLGRRPALDLRRLRRGQAGAGRPRLRRPAALLGAERRRSRPRRRDRRSLRPRHGRRVSGHQPPAVLDPAGAEARRARADRRRRRRPVDLSLPRCHGRNILDFQATSTRRRRSSRWSATTARRSRCSPPPTPSSTSPASASPRGCGASGPRPTSRSSSPSPTKPDRCARSSTGCWRTERPGPR